MGFIMTASLATTRSKARPSAEPMVLILNSDRATRRWIEAIVISTGLRAASFESEMELLARVPSDTATCAILDLVSPGASAFELQQRLAGAGAAVVFVTSEHCISSCVKALKAGAVDYLTMPCSTTELVQALRTAVRQALSSLARRHHLNELRYRYQLLTPREQEVFALVSSGMLNKQIAQLLAISDITVQIHRGRVMKKMRAASFAALVRMADALLLQSQLSCASAWRLPLSLDSVVAPHAQQIAHCFVEQ